MWCASATSCAPWSRGTQRGNGSIRTCRQGPPALLAFLEPAKTVHAVMKVYQGHCKGACERLLVSTARRLASGQRAAHHNATESHTRESSCTLRLGFLKSVYLCFPAECTSGYRDALESNAARATRQQSVASAVHLAHATPPTCFPAQELTCVNS